LGKGEEVASQTHESRNPDALGGGPQDVTEVTWSKHKGGTSGPIILFRGFGNLRSQRDPQQKLLSHETRNTFSSEGRGHVGWSRGVKVHV
jgi:hypothetical protein